MSRNKCAGSGKGKVVQEEGEAAVKKVHKKTELEGFAVEEKKP